MTVDCVAATFECVSVKFQSTADHVEIYTRKRNNNSTQKKESYFQSTTDVVDVDFHRSSCDLFRSTRLWRLNDLDSLLFTLLFEFASRFCAFDVYRFTIFTTTKMDNGAPERLWELRSEISETRIISQNRVHVLGALIMQSRMLKRCCNGRKLTSDHILHPNAVYKMH